MWIKIFKETISDFIDDKCPRIAAAVAYYTAFALAPMLVLIISVAQIAFEPDDLRGTIRNEVEAVVGTGGAKQIEAMLDTSRKEEEQGILATLIGGIVLLVGATGLFAQLQSALNDVWEVKPDPRSGILHFLQKRIVSLGMLLTLAFLVMVSISASSLLHTYDDVLNRWLPGQSGSSMIILADYGVTLAVLVTLFAAMFRYLPDARISWSTVWFGAAVTAVLFLVGKFLVAMYVANAGTTTVFGAAGSFVAILIWAYYSALIFLLGAELTQVWAKQFGNGIVPEQGAVRIVTTTQKVERPSKN